MPIHSASSRKKLIECHPDLQRLVHAVSDKIGLLVICGHRGKVEQNQAFMTGKSKLSWPHSKHNKLPSWAVDLAPDPLDWNDIAAFKELGAIVKDTASELGILIKWGGDFITWKDYPHYELVNPSKIDHD
jgi:hypothetical protein